MEKAEFEKLLRQVGESDLTVRQIRRVLEMTHDRLQSMVVRLKESLPAHVCSMDISALVYHRSHTFVLFRQVAQGTEGPLMEEARQKVDRLLEAWKPFNVVLEGITYNPHIISGSGDVPGVIEVELAFAE